MTAAIVIVPAIEVAAAWVMARRICGNDSTMAAHRPDLRQAPDRIAVAQPGPVRGSTTKDESGLLNCESLTANRTHELSMKNAI